MFRSFACTAAIALTCAVGSAEANVLNFSKSNGTHSASATFAFSNNGGQKQLNITLTNTMTTNSGPNWLTGLFFDIAGAPTLNTNAVTGDLITLNGTTQTAYNAHTPAQMWAFRDDIDGALSGQQYGLGACGFGVFGPSDMIQPGGPHPQPNGTPGGILADIAGLSVPPGHQGKPFALGSLSFTFLLDNSFDVNNASVDNVAFVFGSSFGEVVLNGDGPPPPPPVVPVPMALPMAVAGLAGVAIYRRRATKN
jgi:hypothetical protein